MSEEKNVKEIFDFIEENGLKQLSSVFNEDEYERYNQAMEIADSLKKEPEFIYIAGEINAYLG